MRKEICYCCLLIKLCLTLVAPWTVSRQAPLSMGSSRQGHWGGLPFPEERNRMPLLRGQTNTDLFQSHPTGIFILSILSCRNNDYIL